MPDTASISSILDHCSPCLDSSSWHYAYIHVRVRVSACVCVFTCVQVPFSLVTANALGERGRAEGYICALGRACRGLRVLLRAWRV